MLMPSRVKYRKPFRRPLKGKAKGGTTVAFGEYGIQTLECAWITARQIEATRIALSRKMRRGGKIWIRIFPDRPYTKKRGGTRMGKGKGSTEFWVAPVKRGRILFEMAGIPREVAAEAFRTASHKLPVKVRMVVREGLGGE
ncbi:MAG: 50S ribosomal protein L16 [Synergistaceae bacterium]|nr:50S ribosomal protein L16 [Synergistaceae bacterium]